MSDETVRICRDCGFSWEAHSRGEKPRGCHGWLEAPERVDSPQDGDVALSSTTRPAPSAAVSSNLEGLNLRELLLGDVTRMAHVYRFSTVQVLKRESSAEHSWFTAWFTVCLCLWVNENLHIYSDKSEPDSFREVDTGKAVLQAICHDMEECRTGDINRLFKHSNGTLRNCIDAAAQRELIIALDPLFPENPACSSGVFNTWLHSKNTTREGRVVSLADFLSVVSYMWGEIRSSNQTMHRYHQSVKDYADSFSDPSFDFLRPVVDEVQALVQEIFSQRLTSP